MKTSLRHHPKFAPYFESLRELLWDVAAWAALNQFVPANLHFLIGGWIFLVLLVKVSDFITVDN